MTSCMSAPPKAKIETWLIDAETDVLFRRKDDETEYAIPIKGNAEDMKKFMCFPTKSIDNLIEVRLGTSN